MVLASPPGFGKAVLTVTCPWGASAELSWYPMRMSLSSNSTRVSMLPILSHSPCIVRYPCLPTAIFALAYKDLRHLLSSLLRVADPRADSKALSKTAALCPPASFVPTPDLAAM